MKNPKNLAIVVVVAAVLGFVFAAYSTYDYAAHLDRQVHAVHCSFIPGAPASGEGDNACKAALFSPYSALFRQTWWGGVPISLFAVGAFAFFLAFGVYLLLAKERAPRIAFLFLGVAGVLPFCASVVMFLVSAIKLHAFCKLCVGIYVSSAALATAGVFAILRDRSLRSPAAPAAAPAANAPDAGSLVLAGGWLAGLGVAAALPALVYVASLPDYRKHLDGCGTIKLKAESHGALVKIPTSHPARKATLFEDPLCPSCKAFHQRLVAEGIYENLDVTLVLFPLDTTCNWMLDRSLHPGACLLSGAVLCSGSNARATLEWAYDNQDELLEAGKAGGKALEQKIAARFGNELATCAADKKTATKVNQHLHYAADHRIPVSTPQMILADRSPAGDSEARRICEEDTDLGLKYTLAQLAPEVVK